jgi:hypothetical protein
MPVVTEPKRWTLFIWKSSIRHSLELVVFTCYLFLSLFHFRGFTITVLCWFYVSIPVFAVYTSAVTGMFCWVCPASYTAQPRYDVHSPGFWPSQCVIFQIWCGWYHRWAGPFGSHTTVQWSCHCTYLHLSLMSLHNWLSGFTFLVSLVWYIFSETVIQVDFNTFWVHF